MSSDSIDVLYTKESYALKSLKIGNLVLLDKLKKLAFEFEKTSNFTLFHQRNPHSPYQDNYKGYNQAVVFPMSDDVVQSQINAHDNAIIFSDYIISSIFEKFKILKLLLM